jgi:prevent-host-death family protein
MSAVSASNFKAHCLEYMDTVNQKHKTFVITKHGKPVAKLVPCDEDIPELFGAMEGTGLICGDIIAPLDTEWEADKE